MGKKLGVLLYQPLEAFPRLCIDGATGLFWQIFSKIHLEPFWVREFQLNSSIMALSEILMGNGSKLPGKSYMLTI